MLFEAISEAIALHYGSTYAAAKAIAQATGQDPKTAHARLRAYGGKDASRSLRSLNEDMDRLGLEIKIVKKADS